MDPKELRRMLSEATPGRARTGRECVYIDTGHAAGDPGAPDTRILCGSQADCELDAAMRNALPAMLDVVEAVRAYKVAANALADWYARCDDGEHDGLGDDDFYDQQNQLVNTKREAWDRLNALADRLAKGRGE